MGSFTKVKATMAILIAAMVPSVVAIPRIEPMASTTVGTHDNATMLTSSMTTAPAVWTQAIAPTNNLAAQALEDGLVSVKGYCTTEEHPGSQVVDYCVTVTHPLTFVTRTITHYPALPTAGEGRCGRAWYVTGLTDKYSPLAADCIELAHRISGEGEWKFSSLGIHLWHQLVEWGTCAFGCRISAIEALGLIGNQDIIDIIVDSVRDFTLDGKVAAKMRMDCRNTAGFTDVWTDCAIYHTAPEVIGGA
jgi:hypothetical protein